MGIIKEFDYSFASGEKIFFTSDLHFYHRAIIGFCNRPFKDVEEMNQKLIENWNSVVPTDGIVFDLGDFCFGNATKWIECGGQLNGKHYLIAGNHCYKNLKQSAEFLFEDIQKEMRIKIEGQEIWLSHMPFLCYPHSYGDLNNTAWNLFGHVHSGPGQTGKDIERLQYLQPYQYDVGVDNNFYTPISFYQIKKILENRGNVKVESTLIKNR